MNRVIKEYSKLPSSIREEVFERYTEGDIERTSFPYKGKIVDGVIFKNEEVHFLVPIATIISGRAGSSNDLDDDDDASEVSTELEED